MQGSGIDMVWGLVISRVRNIIIVLVYYNPHLIPKVVTLTLKNLPF